MVTRRGRPLRYAQDMGERERLVEIVDAAVAQAASNGGEKVVCRPGCNDCCRGPFPISGRDGERLREGLAALAVLEPDRAARIRERARAAVAKMRREYPADPVAGMLGSEDAADDLCCGVDPETGRCDLYESRPLACRTFGAPLRTREGVTVCELCFPGASDEEIAASAVELDADDLETELAREAGLDAPPDPTLVAFALESE
jgi:Fe-S-cluster containining protein